MSTNACLITILGLGCRKMTKLLNKVLVLFCQYELKQTQVETRPSIRSSEMKRIRRDLGAWVLSSDLSNLSGRADTQRKVLSFIQISSQMWGRMNETWRGNINCFLHLGASQSKSLI